MQQADVVYSRGYMELEVAFESRVAKHNAPNLVEGCKLY